MAAALFVGAILVPAAFASPASADVTSVDGGGFAASVELGTLLGPVSIGPLSPVDLPDDGGGPFTSSLAGIAVSGVLETGLLETSTEGGNLGSHQGFATSSASVADPRVLGLLTALFGGPLLSANLIQAECTSNGDGSSGETTLANADLLNFGILDVNPAPNTQIDLLGLATVTLNEQIVENVPGSHTSITVNAIHITVNVLGLVTGDVIISQARCEASGPDVLCPDNSCVEPPVVVEPPGGPGGPATAVVAAPRFTG